MYTCPNTECEDHGIEFYESENFCSLCGTKLAEVDDDDDEVVDADA